MRKVVLGLAAGIAAFVLQASAQTTERRENYIVLEKWDLDAVTETFAALALLRTQGTANITTSGSSTTVTAVDGTPFAPVGVSTLLLIEQPGASPIDQFRRTVSAKASDTSITVDSAIDLDTPSTGFRFGHRTTTAGTGATSGQFDVSRYSQMEFSLDILQMAVTGTIDVRFLCKESAPDSQWRQVYPELVPPAAGPTYISFSAAGGFIWATNIRFARCRLGAKISSADDGGDLTTNQEQISLSVDGAIR